MRNTRTRAAWMTLLVYALAGPLIGLLCFIVVGIAIEMWGPIVDRLQALTVPAPDYAACGPYSGHFDLRCFQRGPEPRPFPSFGRPHEPSMLILFTYLIGFIPAVLAGLLICAGRLSIGGANFRYAVLIGSMIGVITGLLAVQNPWFAILLFFQCLIATIVCWFVTRRWWRNAEDAVTVADVAPPA